MLTITPHIQIPFSEIDITTIRSQGPGGQHVNKTESAVQLKFDIHGSSLPDEVKMKLETLKDRRISKDGVIIIKAQRSRSQIKNKEDAFLRLKNLIEKALKPVKPRKKTKPKKSAIEKRLESKKKRGQIKSMRSKVDY